MENEITNGKLLIASYVAAAVKAAKRKKPIDTEIENALRSYIEHATLEELREAFLVTASSESVTNGAEQAVYHKLKVAFFFQLDHQLKKTSREDEQVFLQELGQVKDQQVAWVRMARELATPDDPMNPQELARLEACKDLIRVFGRPYRPEPGLER